MWLTILLFIAGLAALIWGADKLVDAASHLAHRLGVHPILVGMTILSVGTSIPEISTSIFSNVMGHGDIATGNIIGSILAQLCLVLGLVALIHPLEGKRKEILFYGITMIGSVLLSMYVMRDGVVDFADGLVLITAYSLFMAHIIGNEHITNHHFKKKHDKFWHHNLAMISVGMGFTIIGSHFVVDSTVKIAGWLGAPEFFIAFFAVGFGTSLPELIVSIVAAAKKNFSMSVGNILGSNIADATVSLGAGLLFTKGATVSPMAGPLSVYLLIVCTIFVAWFAWRKHLGRVSGLVLILTYLCSLLLF